MNRFTLFLASTHKICYFMRRKRESQRSGLPEYIK